jgi:hypothetical protein
VGKKGRSVGDVVIFVGEIVASRLHLERAALARGRLEDENCVLAC